jgi:hypothetical protein
VINPKSAEMARDVERGNRRTRDGIEQVNTLL